jgi:hypothetical protein
MLLTLGLDSSVIIYLNKKEFCIWYL